MRKLFVELGTLGTCRELTLVQLQGDWRAFHKVFFPGKEGCGQVRPPLKSLLMLPDQVTPI